MSARDILYTLEKWAISENRKPLEVRGARQVEKTVAVKMFGESFERFIYLNLEFTENADVFRRRPNVRDLIQAILLISNPPSAKGKTLLFLDEIQNAVHRPGRQCESGHPAVFAGPGELIRQELAFYRRNRDRLFDRTPSGRKGNGQRLPVGRKWSAESRKHPCIFSSI